MKGEPGRRTSGPGAPTFMRASVGACVVLVVGAIATSAATAGLPYHTIKVVDEQTGRGVPLVELETVNNIKLYTDSNGIAAFHEPGLMGERVFIHVRSHGYEFPRDGLGMAGRAIDVKPGGRTVLTIRRVNIAERLYRITGAGIYRDSVLVGEAVPIEQPVLSNAKVFGQDSILNAIYAGKLYWFWGDTNRPSYPLGNFQMTGATTSLPGDGGLDPDLGVNLTYFTSPEGYSKEMAPVAGEGPTWADGPFVLRDKNGRERMFAPYAKIRPDGTMATHQCGLLEWNDSKQVFEKVVEWDVKAPCRPGGHPFRYRVRDTDYLYFTRPFPTVRVAADVEKVRDLANYEAWTCFREGSRADRFVVDRSADGRPRYAWRKDAPPIAPKEQAEAIKAGQLKAEEAFFHVQEADTGKAVQVHGGSVYWNEYRRRWVMIAAEIMGTSVLGETWYLEADTPLGPWVYARKIVTHEKYSFYNPRHHVEFDKDNGRILYFEGTYTAAFSGNPCQTPRYDYNQIMYKLDLGESRLALPVPAYDLSEDGVPVRFATARQVEDVPSRPIAFFALDRPRPGAVPLRAEATAAGGWRWVAGHGTTDAGDDECFLYVLPANVKDPPATTTPLYEFVNDADGRRAYSTDSSFTRPGFRRSGQPICRVWRSPVAACPPE